MPNLIAKPENATTAEAAYTAEHGHRNLILAALGVVYGDIGTSPLYAVKQCFATAGVPMTEGGVLGVLSLITWALAIVVTVKYVSVVLRADNAGEGGILALTALALRATAGTRRSIVVLSLGLCGAALFYGDGVLTPAISVLSAVEGLSIAAPALEPFVLPITVVLLVVIFMVQRRGTAKVGAFFGPIIIVWFVVLATLGSLEIVQRPSILRAINPLYGLELIFADPMTGFTLLGSVVLAVTGAEALYADMGHFGARPIRRAWLRFVFPALLLNYYGQGALLLSEPSAIDNPFYRLAPEWGLIPLVVLASLATIIASQAVISGAYSLTRQAVQLGYLPRIEVRHTSGEEIGQVYVPRVNTLLLIAVVATVLGFQSSDALGAAYGIAVTGTMTITSILAFVQLRLGLRQPAWRVVPLFALFLCVDLAFLGANLLKIGGGGWFPLIMGAVVFAAMWAWRSGRQTLAAQRAKGALPLATFLANLKPDRPLRVPGTAVYMTGNAANVPAALLHNMKHNKVLHERNVIMTVRTEDVPSVPDGERLSVDFLDHNFLVVRIRYGFTEAPNIPRALAQCRVMRIPFNLMETSFFVGREKIVLRERSGLPRLWKVIFVLMTDTMLDATEFFRIPVNRVVELGGQVEI